MGYERMHLMWDIAIYFVRNRLFWPYVVLNGKVIAESLYAWHKRLIVLVFVKILTLFQRFYTGVPW